MKYLAKEHHIFSMSPENKPALYVNNQEIFQLQTLDCFCGRLKKDGICPPEALNQPCTPATGPVYINGAMPGDTLKIEILKIDVEKQGITEIDTDFGVLPHLVKNSLAKTLPIQENKILFHRDSRSDLQFDLQPMIGVIGVSPREGSIPTDTPDIHGGNLDCTQIREGSCLYLPVQVPGALLALGDLHACMGDGEIGGCGAEIAGEVTLRVSVISGQQKPYPIVETEEKLIILASGKTLDEACEAAAEAFCDFLVSEMEFTSEDAVMLLSLVGNLFVCQAVNPQKTVGVWVWKKIIFFHTTKKLL